MCICQKNTNVYLLNIFCVFKKTLLLLNITYINFVFKKVYFFKKFKNKNIF